MSKVQYPLKSLFWECTLRCNAFCAFCGSRCGEVHSEELSTAEILSAFRDVAQKLDPQTIMINVTGGEPLLRKDLFDVMKVCSELGFPWGMVTNGILITPQIISQMQESGMKTISVSLDGLRETHEELRGVKGCYDTILLNLKLLREAGFLDHLQVTTVVSKRNIGELDDLYALLKPIGLDSCRVAMVDPIGRAQEQNRLLLDKEDIQQYLGFIRSHQNDAELPVITSCSHYYGNENLRGDKDGYVCHAGKTVASILTNGDIFVCPNVPRRSELIQGNVCRDSLPEVWKSGFKQFRNPLYRRGKTCKGCPDWTACWGDSAHTWDYDGNEPKFCYREALETQQEKTIPVFEDVMGKIKETVSHLSGIHIRYGWKNSIPVVFTPNAAAELYHYFHWGQRHPQNLSEQMAALIGHRLSDGFLVEFVSPVYLAKRNTMQAAFTQESLASGWMETEAINVSYHDCEDLKLLDTPCSLLGFVHSHPDELDLFLSEADARLHRILMEKDIALSVIVHPQKRQLSAFYGNRLENAEIPILTEHVDVHSWNISGDE